MTDSDLTSLPGPVFAGGTKAITLTPVVGTPRREYAERFVPGEEELEDGELRVTVLASGDPWATRAQASASIVVEVGNPERDLLVFDHGTGSLANYASLKLPPTPGAQRAAFTPTALTPPEWWAEARIPLDDIGTPGS
jgi:ribonuclease Z